MLNVYCTCIRKVINNHNIYIYMPVSGMASRTLCADQKNAVPPSPNIPYKSKPSAVRYASQNEQLFPVRAIFTHAPEHSTFLEQKVSWRVELEHLASGAQNEDAIVIHDGLQTVSNSNNLWVRKG